MSFPVQLQTNHSEDIRVDKHITDIITLMGTLKGETSIITPTILIEGNVSDLAVCNYMTISAFGRRYYVTDIRSVRANIVEVSGRTDVLGTWGAQIRACQGIVYKQENLWNTYLDDGTFKVYQNPQVVTKAFPGFFAGDLQFIFAVAGKP